MTTASDPRLARRLLVLRLAALGGAAAVPVAASAQGTKSGGAGSPGGKGGTAPPPQRSGITDADPTDAPGQGRNTRP